MLGKVVCNYCAGAVVDWISYKYLYTVIV